MVNQWIEDYSWAAEMRWDSLPFFNLNYNNNKRQIKLVFLVLATILWIFQHLL